MESTSANQTIDPPGGRITPQSRRIMAIGLAVALALSAVYLALSPSIEYQHYDSLIYAYTAETQGLGGLWGNHPLGHFVLNAAYALADGAGYAGRALPLFQGINSLLAGAALGLFFVMAVKLLRVQMLVALAVTLILGVTASFWNYAGTADIYGLAWLLALATWMALLQEVQRRQRRALWWSGILLGLAILAHQLNAVTALAGLVLIFGEQGPRRGWLPVGSFLMSAGVVAALGYWSLGLLATGSPAPPAIVDWMAGHFGNPSYGRFFNLASIPDAWTGASSALVRLSWSLGPRAVRIGILLLLFGVALGGLANLRWLSRQQRLALGAASLELTAATLLILWWEPMNVKFWLLAVLPWMIILACSAEAVRLRLVRLPAAILRDRASALVGGFLLALGLLLLLFNLTFGLVSRSRSGAAYEQAMQAWLSHSTPDDILMTAGDLIPQLQFWENRPNTINLYRALVANRQGQDPFANVKRQIDDALCRGNAVLLTPAFSDAVSESRLSVVPLSRSALYEFFASYTLEEAFTYPSPIMGADVSVYRVLDAGQCTQQETSN